MPICEWCGKEFDSDDAEYEFDAEIGLLSYENIKPHLCGGCAVQAIQDEVDGVYFETCEQCGKHFDFIADNGRFTRYFPDIDLLDCWEHQILCCDCAMEEAEAK